MLVFDSGPLVDPYGYVYRVESKRGVYVGQHKWQSGEAWESYKGSGKRVSRCRKSGLEKFLVCVASSQAELDLLEMVEIARARAAQECLLNVLDGGKHRWSRRRVEFLVFKKPVSDSEFVLGATGEHREACLKVLSEAG